MNTTFRNILRALSSLSIVLVIGSLTNANAQSFQPSFRNYTVDDGLPSSEVHVAIQDNDGYMWFGTDNGLSRFDGYEFKNYGTQEGLKNPVIFDLKIGPEGKLWILTMSGNIYIYNGIKLKPYKFNHLISKHEGLYSWASSFYISDNQTVNICLELLGILSIDQEGKHILEKYNVGSIVLISREDNFMTYLQIHKSTEASINYKDSLERNNMSPPINVISKSDNYNFHFESKNRHSYSAIKLNNDYYLLQLSNKTVLFRYAEILMSKESSTRLNDIHYIDSLAFWIGLHDKKGIQIYDSVDDLKSNKFIQVLSGASVSSIYQDRNNSMWITTLQNGLFYCSNIYSTASFDSNLLPAQENISSISLSSKGLYISTRSNDVLFYNIENNSLDQIQRFKPNHPIGYFLYGYDIRYDNKRHALLGGGKSSIWQNNKWESINFNLTNLPLNLKKISSNEYNDDILVVSPQIIGQINLKDKRFTDHTDYGKNRFHSANFDHNGNRWIGRNDGLFLWDKDSTYRHPNTPNILTKRIEAIEFLSNKDMVLGTKGDGVIVWDKKNIKYKITTDRGLTSDMIENIFIDSLDKIWVGTLNGLNRITLNTDNTFTVKQFTKKHGLPGNEITDIQKRNDHVFVATTTGLGRITDSPPNKNTTTPIIKEFQINGKLFPIKSENYFTHNDNNITFQYVSLDYIAQGDIPYRFKLHPNEPWQLTKNTTINLPGLAPNKYRIEIQAQNEDGYWSDSLSIPFTILQPYWKRPWFLGITGLLSLLLVGRYFRNKQKATIANIKKDHSIKTQIVELERSALQAQMNPHFIFNILNSIQLAINQNENTKASHLLSKFSKLIRATLKNAKSDTISLAEEVNYIKSYLHLEQVRHKNFSYDVICEEELDLPGIHVPPMLVQPFVENAIKHGMRNDNKAKIKVTYKLDNDYLIVKIRDNGPGFDNGSDTDHESMGMSITQRRLELINQNNSNSKPFHIYKLSDPNGHFIGTEIELSVKVS